MDDHIEIEFQPLNDRKIIFSTGNNWGGCLYVNIDGKGTVISVEDFKKLKEWINDIS